MLLTETKIQLEAYSQNRLGYDVTCLAARPSSAGGSQVGIGLATRERPVRWGIESTRFHMPNMVSCDIITGLTQNLIIGVYLPPLTLEHLPDLENSLQRFRYLIFFGDLNVDLNEARSLRSQCELNLLAEYVLIDPVRHF